MTIKGVKMILQNEHYELDEINNETINKKIIKTKINKLSKLIKKLKVDG